MPSYIAETYLGRGQVDERLRREQRFRLAATELTREHTGVRFERSIHIPEDEICLFLFEAPSEQDAVALAESAGLDAFRVVEAISSGKE